MSSLRHLSIAFSLFLFGCERYPSELLPVEQIQAVVFKDLASESLRGYKGDALPLLFFSLGERSAGSNGDPSTAVLDYLQHEFSTIRPFSQAEPFVNWQPRVVEKFTGKEGMIFRIEPVPVSGADRIALRASYYIGPQASEGFEYRLKYEGGKWKIIERKRLWIS